VIVTESKLTELTGYTSGEIKNRRQRHWQEGHHYYYDGGGKTVYDVKEIQIWQKGSPKNMADVVSTTNSTEFVTSNDYQSPTRLQELKKRKKYV
tara:strand:+ start:1030 stop:1311 length:282 start_codon:yes stop_codon:yes gene_type:complete